MEAYRDGIKRKGDKIGMVSTCGMSSNVKVVARFIHYNEVTEFIEECIHLALPKEHTITHTGTRG